MATTVMLRHKESGITKKGYFGFSWTYFFFGWFVPLFRGEIGIGFLHLFASIFTFGIWQIIFAFLYNKQFMLRQMEKGYLLNDTAKLMSQAREKLQIVEMATA